MALPIVDLMPGARVLVRDYAVVQKGEEVLIIEDRSGFPDPLVVEAIALACEEAGADVTIASVRHFEARLEEPPKTIQAAYRAGIRVFDLGKREASFHGRACRIGIFEYGLKHMNVIANTPELLASEWARYPVELMTVILQKVDAQVRAARSIRVVSTNGTDVSAGLSPSQLTGGPRNDEGIPVLPTATSSPVTGMWPLGVLGTQPMLPVKGTLIFDALIGFNGLLKEPVKVTIEDGWATKVEGGYEAKWFWNLIQSKKKQGVDSADYFTEIMWGLCPRASIERGLQFTAFREAEVTRRAGTLHFGFGKLGRGFHWDGILIKPFSVYVDGKTVVIDNCRLKVLDDPEVRAVAAKYGDPDKLLTELP